MTPYTQSMSLTIERQFGHDINIQMSYAGKLTQKLEGHRFWNAAVFEPDPRTGAAPSIQNANNRVFYTSTIGLYSTQNRILGNDYRSSYHSAQVRAGEAFQPRIFIPQLRTSSRKSWITMSWRGRLDGRKR